jgi:hypothetical protein
MSIAPSFVVDAVEMPPIVLEGTVFAIAAGKVEARPHRDFTGLLQVFPPVLSRQYIASYSRSVMSCLSDRPSPPDTSPCSPQQPYGSKLHLSRSRFRLPSPFPADRRAPLLSPIWLLGCPSVQTRLGRRGRKYHNRCSCWSQLYCQGGSRCCRCQSV